MKRSPQPYFVLVTAIVGLLACDNAERDDVSDSEYDEVATVVGALNSDSSRGEVHLITDSASVFLGATPEWMAEIDGELGGVRAGVSVKVDVDCRDADGAEVACGASAMSADVKAQYKGDWDGPHLDAKAEWKGDWKLERTGVDRVRINGKASAKLDSVYVNVDGTERRWDIDYDVAFDDVVATSTRQPVGGSASYYLRVKHTVDGPTVDSKSELQVDADVVFDADGGAEIILDGTRRYRLDTDTGTVARMKI